MKSGPDRLAERSVTKTFAQGEKGYYLVQFDGPIRAKQKKKLKKLGAQVFDYLPDFAFIVKISYLRLAQYKKLVLNYFED